MKQTIILLVAIFLYTSCTPKQQEHTPGGHSHNDYYRERPLLDALENGMSSIEADVFLKNGKILVGHDTGELNSNQSLEALYLKPLSDEVSKNKQFTPIILLVDIKTDGKNVYKALKTLLQPYQSMLTHYENGKVHPGAVTIILSGSRPIETVENETDRYVFIDGRISDLNSQKPTHVFPLISDDWTRFFSWNGEGNMPPQQMQKLKELVETCHAQNKKIRFWGYANKSPYMENIWKALLDAHVDLIGCDCPKCLKDFLQENAVN